jgi:hypothetical protein
LLDWKIEKENGLEQLGVEASEEIEELELAMAHLIQASN